MNIRTVLAGLTLTLGTLASAPAFAQGYPSRGYPVATPVARPTRVVVVPAAPIARPVVIVRPAPDFWQRNASFVARVRMQMSRIERSLRNDVARGRVQPQALGALSQERTRVENTLERAGRDHFITSMERRQVNAMVYSMARLDDQFRIRHHSNRYGYGYGR